MISAGGGLPDFEVTCKNCGWEFVVDHTGSVRDDGDLDEGSLLEFKSDESEVDAEGLRDYRCPYCARITESDPCDSLRCAGCRRQYWTEDCLTPRVVEDEDEDSYEWLGCPNCLSDGDIDGEPMTGLGQGWTLCHRCGFKFWMDDEDCWLRATDRGACKIVIGRAQSLDDLYQLHDLRRADIRVAAGVHAGQIGFEVPRLHLTGPAPPAIARLHGRLRFFGVQVRLRRLTLTREISFNDCQVLMEECRLLRGVEAIDSRLMLRNCEVSNQNGNGVGAFQGTVLRMRNCDIRNCLDIGLLVEAGAWARLRDTRITVCRGDGIRVRPRNRLFLHHCSILKNQGVGIRIQQGQVVIMGSDVTGNHLAGLEIQPRSRAVLLHSRVVDNLGADIAKNRPTQMASRWSTIGAKTTIR
jgi:hypothetical protein